MPTSIMDREILETTRAGKYTVRLEKWPEAFERRYVMVVLTDKGYLEDQKMFKDKDKAKDIFDWVVDRLTRGRR